MNRSIAASILLACIALAGCGPNNSTGDAGDSSRADGTSTIDSATDAARVDADAASVCTVDLDCTDHVFCNGAERCMPGAAGADARGCVAPAAPACATGSTCNEATQRCDVMCPDADGDGHRAASCGGDDCDDADTGRFPGNTEVCDGAFHDEDCDACTVGGTDADSDHDTYPSNSCGNRYTGATPACDPTHVAVDGAMHMVTGLDCNDANGNVHPMQVESCNHVDDNCNGMVDEDVVVQTYVPDCDGDMFGTNAPGAMTAVGCAPPTTAPATCPGGFWSTFTTDCNDTSGSVNPGATELCNGIDDNCDGQIDEGTSASSYYPDCDGDTFGRSAAPVVSCGTPSSPPPCGGSGGSWVLNQGDCNDNDSTINPMSQNYACGTMCGTPTNPLACGASCTACSTAVTNAHPTCAAGTCGYACNAGYAPSGSTCVLVRAPRNIAPMSTSYVTTRRPTMRVSLGAGTDGVHLEFCRDRACASVITTVDATGSTGAPSVDLPVGTVFWRAAGRIGTVSGTAYGATWQFNVPAASATRDGTWGTNPDVNGDGYSDVVAGAACDPWMVGSCGPNPGRIYVFFGSSSGAPVAPSQTIVNPDGASATPGGFGRLVASAGDVNGDGFVDVIAGEPTYGATLASGGQPGRAQIFLGSATGLRATPSATLEITPAVPGFGTVVSSAGDMNRDGYGDVVVSNSGTRAYVFLGGSGGLSTTPAATIQASVATLAGDLNADGFSDIVNIRNASGAGTVEIFLGSAAGPSATPSSSVPLGVPVSGRGRLAGAGDTNRDGYADIIVSADGSQVAVFNGSATGLATTAAFTTPVSNLVTLAGLGDTDGDGSSDVAVSVNLPSVMVYGGGSAGIGGTPTTLSMPTGGNMYFGQTVAAGDIDRDGDADVFVYAGSVFPGRVFEFAGGAGGVPMSPSATITCPTMGYTGFGAGLASNWIPSRSVWLLGS